MDDSLLDFSNEFKDLVISDEDVDVDQQYRNHIIAAKGSKLDHVGVIKTYTQQIMNAKEKS